ncbi:MAG: GGDEF domain-containing protein [Streptomycetaceae bacterium]|jgi:GGDEF domain-containing protein|nr:MAG: GGDEF domain-containing protein [Streptomycetaceae bacterium]
MEERLTHLRGQSPLFSHDGIHDSQTHLAAPSFFYEQLRREIAIAKRSKANLSLIKIVFERKNVDGVRNGVNAEDILRFSFELRRLTRNSECIGRLGINECVILISEGEAAANKMLSRLHVASSLTVNDSLRISLSIITSLPDESGLEILNRLDLAALSTH